MVTHAQPQKACAHKRAAIGARTRAACQEAAAANKEAKRAKQAAAYAKNAKKEMAAKKKAEAVRLLLHEACVRLARMRAGQCAGDRADVAFAALSLHTARCMLHVQCWVECRVFFVS
jgi:hypothetical protein